MAGKPRRYGMAPAHIPVFLSQKRDNSAGSNLILSVADGNTTCVVVITKVVKVSLNSPLEPDLSLHCLEAFAPTEVRPHLHG